MGKCKECKYCEQENLTIKDENNEDQEVVRFFCCYNPPQIVFIEDDIQTWFPFVSPTMGCGHWVLREEKTQDIEDIES